MQKKQNLTCVDLFCGSCAYRIHSKERPDDAIHKRLCSGKAAHLFYIVRSSVFWRRVLCVANDFAVAYCNSSTIIFCDERSNCGDSRLYDLQAKVNEGATHSNWVGDCKRRIFCAIRGYYVDWEN